MSRRQLGRSLLLLAGLALAFRAAAPADQIVLTDGQTIETRGPVKLESRRAVYTDLAGRLVALRIEEVDIARTTAPTPVPPPKGVATTPAPDPTVAKPKAPVLRLTDADVGHLEDPDDAAAPGARPAPVVTLYSTPWCGWCRKSRQLLQSLGIAFVEKDVESDPRAAAEKARLAPGSGVPVLVRGGEVVRGFSEATLRSWAPAVKAGKS